MMSRGAMGGYKVGYKRQRTADTEPYRMNYGGHGYYGGSYHFGQSRSAFPVVRLRGLPFNCRESDVFEFFAGLDIVDVLLVRKQGRFYGEAFVVLGAPMQVDYALQRDRQNMGRRYIEVFRCKKQDYYQAIAAELNYDSKPTDHNNDQSVVASAKPGNKNSMGINAEETDSVEHSGVLKLRGLPFSVCRRDIIQFFGDFDLCDENVQIVTQSDGKATGEAFVEFCSAEDSKAAMSKDKMMIGNRYVELFPSTQDEAGRAASKSGH